MSARWQKEAKRAAPSASNPPPTAPRLQPPLGQGPVLGAWLARARRLELPHALVVEGPPGSGKTTVLRWLSAALLCPSELDQEGPCGVCRTCARVASDSHPDVQWLERARDEQDKEDNKHQKKSFHVISIEQVRHAQEVLQRHAIEGRARILRIDDADCMSEPAQNALLKTLEEPGATTFLLLEATTPEHLLPTVRSRVQRLRVLPLPDDTIEAQIRQRSAASGDPLRSAIRMARGSLGQALLACTEHAVQLHDLVLSVLGTNKGLRPVATARAVVEGAKEPRLALDRARLFLWLLRSEIRARRDGLAGSAALAYPGAPAEPWTTWLELTLAAEQDLILQIPPEQALCACLLQFEAA